MNLSIQRFSFLILFVLLSVLISFFSYNYFSQQEKTASVILKSINSQISETSYILSKRIKNKESVKTVHPMLDRIAAHNDFIAAILIHDENNVLLSTDPQYKKILDSHSLYKKNRSNYKEILEAKAIESDIKFYEGDKAVFLKLQFDLDKEEINSYFAQRQVDYLIYFITIPLIIIILLSLLMRYFILKPLERLRQFAHYQSDIPKAFKLKELEIIRHSMVQTFQRLESEKNELYSIARTDLLSGLANRNALNEYTERLIEKSKRAQEEFAFLFLDLDHFKSVNDSLGHNVGDDLLKKVSSIIDEVIRPNDFVARVGGDEFVIIITDYDSIMEVTSIIQRIQKQLAQTWIIQTHPIAVSSSVGIAFYPKDGDSIISLMQHSDIAMYEAKESGRARYHFYTEELNKKVQDAINLDKEMRDALVNDEYKLFYQPKVDINTGKIVGAEALIRWFSPTKGLIAPDTFIPLAEENSFIVELGDWITREAVKQQHRLKNKGLDIIISINISAKQLLKDDFIDKFINLLKEYDVSNSKIDIEITEYMFFQQNNDNFKKLNELHGHGITISLDDFGTGYSSLSYLKKFPIDYLKIDKAFMDDFQTKEGSIFIDTIVKMGQTLNMKIIAEGVEESKQVEYLKSIGCDQYQGYHFSKPISAEEFENKFA